MAVEEKTLLTKEGLKKLEDELENLKTVRRREIAARLQEAISYGDLSENSEYEEAKNEQAFMEGQIIELERMIKNAKVIGQSKMSADTINLGSVVKVKNLETNEDETYTIVGTTEVDVMHNKISNESPLGKALVGQKKGAKVSFKTPGGLCEYQVTKME